MSLPQARDRAEAAVGVDAGDALPRRRRGVRVATLDVVAGDVTAAVVVRSVPLDVHRVVGDAAHL